MNIPITKTEFTDNEKENILKPLDSGWVVQGSFVKEFEDKWSAFTNAKNAIAVTSCTTALHLSLTAMGIGSGDEVILPSYTWVATANSVESVGAKPVFCDIDLKNYNIDVSQISKRINSKTKAIIPVHLFGLSADMKTILNLSKENNITIIEDAACGFGSYYENKHVGNFGMTGCFSFHPRKAITTGEGGIITTDDDELAKKLRSMRDHGASISDFQRHQGPKPYILPEFKLMGYNYRMTDIQASIGVSQMERAEEIISKRTYWAKRYNEELNNATWLKLPHCENDYTHGYQAYVCLFVPEEINIENVNEINLKRNAFMDYLQTKGIATRPGTHAIHTLHYYSKKYDFTETDFPNSFIADRCTITLPLFPALTDQEFDYIIDNIKNYKIS